MWKTEAGIRVVLLYAEERQRSPQTQKLGEGSGTGSSSQLQKEWTLDLGLLNNTFLLSKPSVYLLCYDGPSKLIQQKDFIHFVNEWHHAGE